MAWKQQSALQFWILSYLWERLSEMKQPPSTRQCSQNTAVLAWEGSQLTPSMLDASCGFLQQPHQLQQRFARKKGFSAIAGLCRTCAVGCEEQELPGWALCSVWIGGLKADFPSDSCGSASLSADPFENWLTSFLLRLLLIPNPPNSFREDKNETVGRTSLLELRSPPSPRWLLDNLQGWSCPSPGSGLRDGRGSQKVQRLLQLLTHGRCALALGGCGSGDAAQLFITISISVASAETLTGQRDLNEKVYGKKRLLSAFIRKEFGRKKPDELRISNYLLFSQQSLSSESQRWHVRIRQQNVILTAPNC